MEPIDVFIKFLYTDVDLMVYDHWLDGETAEQVTDKIYEAEVRRKLPERASSSFLPDADAAEAVATEIGGKFHGLYSFDDELEFPTPGYGDGGASGTGIRDFAPLTTKEEFEEEQKFFLQHYVDTYYNLFHQLEKHLQYPSTLSHQAVVQMPAYMKAALVQSYYSFDKPIMREILNRSRQLMSHRAKERDFKHNECVNLPLPTVISDSGADLESAVSDKRPSVFVVPSASAVRQYSNVRRLMKFLFAVQNREELAATTVTTSISSRSEARSLASVLLREFCMSPMLAKEYAAILFLCVHKFDLRKASLTRVPYDAFAECARDMLLHWTLRFGSRAVTPSNKTEQIIRAAQQQQQQQAGAKHSVSHANNTLSSVPSIGVPMTEPSSSSASSLKSPTHPATFDSQAPAVFVRSEHGMKSRGSLQASSTETVVQSNVSSTDELGLSASSADLLAAAAAQPKVVPVSVNTVVAAAFPATRSFSDLQTIRNTAGASGDAETPPPPLNNMLTENGLLGLLNTTETHDDDAHPFLSFGSGPDLPFDFDFLQNLKDLKFLTNRPVLEAQREEFVKRMRQKHTQPTTVISGASPRPAYWEEKSRFFDLSLAILKLAISLHTVPKMRLFFSTLMEQVVQPLSDSRVFRSNTELLDFLNTYQEATEETNEFRIESREQELLEVWQRFFFTFRDCVLRLFPYVIPPGT